jgi:23S rRNA (guanine2445-N2)-methyltransferase / 23S rRNA (guanine2069-N7)-methyltransferase
MSATYLDWARRNMALNGFEEGKAHRLVRADALGWIAEEGERVDAGDADPYDLIFLDPPTFSNSKRMGESTFDVQRDHVELLRATASLLVEGGLLLFSNNLKRFRLDSSAVQEFDIDDITGRTIPKDFERSPRIHHCFEVRVQTDATRESEKANEEG